jgi:AcrR family transcriptional regulator
MGVARRPGSKNKDYEETRVAMAAHFAQALVGPDGQAATLEGLARAAGVSVPTVRHYFGDRDGAFRAALAAVRAQGAARLREMGDPGERSAEDAIVSLAIAVPVAWRRFGLGQVMAGGLALGMFSETRGPTYLEELLEPFLQAAEALLSELVRRGRLAPLDARATALSLLAPIVFALLHQDHLGGIEARPLDVDAFARAHAALVLRGLGVEPRRSSKKRGRGGGA